MNLDPSSPVPTLVVIMLVLISGFFIVGALATFGYIKLLKKQITHPYLFGLLVTSAVGAITTAIISAILFANCGTLEAYVGSCTFATAAIVAAVISGIAIGKLLSKWLSTQQVKPLAL